ncbi:hypothetical protein Pmani_002453, partial [Petrolisthes manimaculis]
MEDLLTRLKKLEEKSSTKTDVTPNKTNTTKQVLNYNQGQGSGVRVEVTNKQTGESTVSRLLIQAATTKDSGNYTCSQANDYNHTVAVYVINSKGESSGGRRLSMEALSYWMFTTYGTKLLGERVNAAAAMIDNETVQDSDRSVVVTDPLREVRNLDDSGDIPLSCPGGIAQLQKLDDECKELAAQAVIEEESYDET